jgi:hypothetical protein
MKAKYSFIIAGAIAALFASCKDEVKGEFWGETKFYGNFLFKKYEPVKMERTLEFEFNDDARRLVTNDIAFEVVEKDEKDHFVVVKDVVLYKNGEVRSDNILKIKSTETEMKLGIEFTETAREGNHTLYLREKGQSGLDRIDYLELADGFVVKKDDVYNPLGLLLFWVLVVLAIILAVCVIVSRIANPVVKFSNVFIDYHDGAGERKIKMGSAYKLLCTGKRTSFSIFSKFFVGVVKVEVHEFWTHPVTITSGKRNYIRVSGFGEFELDTDERPVRKEPFTITNKNGEKATITTA